MIDWIYSTPTWLWGTVVVVALDAIACLGLIAFNRLVHIDMRRAHNDLTGFTLAVISVMYAVLLAFIAIATWQAFSNSESIVAQEADCVDSVYRDTRGLPAAMAKDIRFDLRQYMNLVVTKEWPEQQKGRIPNEGWEPLGRIHTAIVTMHPATPGEAVIQAELLRTLNMLYHVRNSRLAAVDGHIPTVIWWIIFIGGALTVGYTYLFGFHDLRMHLLITSGISTSLALVVVLIVALDWPFRGTVSVSPDALITTEQSWSTLKFPQPAAAGDAHAGSPLK